MANKKITQLDAVQEALGTDWLPVGREGSNQGTKVSIEQIEEYVEQAIKGNASSGTSDDDLATIGYVNEAVANAGGEGTIELETEINSVNPSNLKVPTSKAVADYVSEAVANAGGGTIDLETEINSVNPSDLKVPTSKAVADYVSDSLPTNVSELNNDAGYLTEHQDISGKEDKPTVITSSAASYTIADLPGNKIYKLGTITGSLDVTVVNDFDVETILYFTVSSATVSFTGVAWINETPDFGDGSWIVSVQNRKAIAGKEV